MEFSEKNIRSILHDSPQHTDAPFRGYGLHLDHKHLPEMRTHARLQFNPIFTPAYGNFRQGIVLYIPIHRRLLPKPVAAEEIHACLTRRYADAQYVNVLPMDAARAISYLEPEYLNDSNDIDLYVFSNEETARYCLRRSTIIWGRAHPAPRCKILISCLRDRKSFLPPSSPAY